MHGDCADLVTNYLIYGAGRGKCFDIVRTWYGIPIQDGWMCTNLVRKYLTEGAGSGNCATLCKFSKEVPYREAGSA